MTRGFWLKSFPPSSMDLFQPWVDSQEMPAGLRTGVQVVAVLSRVFFLKTVQQLVKCRSIPA